MNELDKKYMRRALELAEKGMEEGHGGPFGAIVVREDEIVGEGFNRVLSSHDPTAHAEIVAIRDACKKILDFQLHDATIYTSCEPCPMCLGAIYWARPQRIVMACNREDAAQAGFDDEYIYEELNKQLNDRKIPVEHMMRDKGQKLFDRWNEKEDKTPY